MWAESKKHFLSVGKHQYFSAIQLCAAAVELEFRCLGEGCTGFVFLFYIPLISCLLPGTILRCNIIDLQCDFSMETIKKISSL